MNKESCVIGEELKSKNIHQIFSVKYGSIAYYDKEKTIQFEEDNRNKLLKLDCIRKLILEIDEILFECEKESFKEKHLIHNFYRKIVKIKDDFEKEWNLDLFPIKDFQKVVLGSSGEDLIEYDNGVRNYAKIVLNNVFKISFYPFLNEEFDGDSLKINPKNHRAGRKNSTRVVFPKQ